MFTDLSKVVCDEFDALDATEASAATVKQLLDDTEGYSEDDHVTRHKRRLWHAEYAILTECADRIRANRQEQKAKV